LPLAAGAHPEDDPVECRPPIGGPPPGRLLGPELPEEGTDRLPQGIRDLPDGPQRLGLRLLPSGLALGPGPAGAPLSVTPTQDVTQAGSRPFRRFSDSFLSVTHNIQEQPVRLVAIDADGEEHPAEIRSGSGVKDFRQLVVEFDLPPEQIKEFRVQTR